MASDEQLVRYHNIKGPDSKEQQILNLLRQPGLKEKVTSIAATLNETFSVQTRLLMDIRPGAVFTDSVGDGVFIYQATVTPFDLGALTTLVFREAMHPAENLEDQGYVTFVSKNSDGNRYILGLKDFIKMFAIGRFSVTDFNINDEHELTKNIF